MQIVKGNTTYDGVKEDENGNIVCEKCGQPDRVTMGMHLDGKDFYQTVYDCECGNMINATTKRTGLNKELWR